MQSTKDKLLDAAELLFGEHGVDNVSVRMITSAAKVNLSALGFHYGSRENLIKAVFLRRLLPLSEQRRENLRRLEVAREATMTDVLSAFLDPVLELSRSQHLGERAFLRTLSRTLIDPSPIYREILSNELAGLMEGYLDAFQRAMPEFKREEIGNRLDFALGAIGHALSDPGRRGAYSDEEFLAPVERVMPQVLAFVLAGFKAPPVLTPNT
jgi:AcrR family transcriptional regulator